MWAPAADEVSSGSGSNPTGPAGGDLTGTYPNPLIGEGKVTSAKILDGTVVTADIADNSVTSAKIQDGAVANSDIADNAINSAKIQDGSVNTADLSNGAVTTAKIGDNAVTVVKLPAGATADKYLRGDGIWATPATGITSEADPTWGGENNETGNIWRTGNVGIGTSTPTAQLHIAGIGTGQGNVLFVGQYKPSNPGDPPVSGAGTRMMWYPDKAAFRAGYVNYNYWDKSKIGRFSTAMGCNTTASGGSSTAIGEGATASETGSTAIGYYAEASGMYSTAMGFSPNASGYSFTAMGHQTEASGDYSIAMGYQTNAWGVLSTAFGFSTSASAYSTAIGCNNVGSGNQHEWINTDPLFEIGNGLYIGRHNAMTVLKNGNIGIGTASPIFKLDIEGAINANKGIGTGVALLCNGQEAIWFDGTYYSWGFGGTYNYFADKVTIGNSNNPGNYMLYVQGNAYSTGTWSTSDIRFKKNIHSVEGALDRIMKVRGISFEFRSDEFKDFRFAEGRQFGFIAQELEDVFPEVVKTESNGYKSVNYSSMIPILLESIKTLKTENDRQRSEIMQLKTDYDARLSKLESTMGAILNK